MRLPATGLRSKNLKFPSFNDNKTGDILLFNLPTTEGVTDDDGDGRKCLHWLVSRVNDVRKWSEVRWAACPSRRRREQCQMMKIKTKVTPVRQLGSFVFLHLTENRKRFLLPSSYYPWSSFPSGWRWWLVSAQVVSCCVYNIQLLFL